MTAVGFSDGIYKMEGISGNGILDKMTGGTGSAGGLPENASSCLSFVRLSATAGSLNPARRSIPRLRTQTGIRA
jgi:hypothetical protein